MKFIKKGILTSFQGNGRIGYKSEGLNAGGAMDVFSLKLLNLILRNNPLECAIEIHFPGPLILFEENCIFALSGADFGPKLNGLELILNKLVYAKPGDILTFTNKISGERAYLGVEGGFDTPTWLNSKSTQLQLNHLSIQENQSIFFHSNNSAINKINWGISSRNLQAISNSIRFVPSFEFFKLSPLSKKRLLDSDFVIELESNRMGYKLNGPRLSLETKEEMISSAVEKGTIQLLSNGQLAILMADAQVTGGYPKLGFVIEHDISKLSQMGPNEKIYFEKVYIDFAIDNIKKTENFFEKISKSIAYATAKN